MVSRNRWGQLAVAAVLGFFAFSGAAQAQLIFSAAKNVSNNSDFSFTPQMAVDSAGNIYAVWEDDAANNNNILFSSSTDGGATFSAPKNLSNTSGFPFNPRIFVGSDNNISVVWENTTPGNLDIFYSHSADGGTTFSAPLNVSNDSADSASPQVAADSAGNVFVVWESDTGARGILFSRSLDAGNSFSAPVMLSTNTGGSMAPQMALDPAGNINVVWEDDILSASDITFSRSQDHGATFSAPKSLSHNVGNSNSAMIAVDLSGNINVVWENDSPGNFDIFYTRSTDGGQNFSALLNLSNSPGTAKSAQIATDLGGNINVVWADNTPPSFSTDIYFSRSSNAGAFFSTPQNISSNAGFSTNPSLTVDSGGNINVAWEDTTPGNHDIFFSRSADSGATFSASQNLSGNLGLSTVPVLVSDKKGNLDLVWQDSTGGVSQILFSRFTNTVINHPPVAVAGPDQTLQATDQNGVSVTLDGSKSSDPDNDTLTYVWTDQSNNTVGNTAIVQLTLLPGTYTFTLTVTDPGNLGSSATTHVTVNAPVTNHPPVANAGPNQAIACAGQNGTVVTLNGSASSDPDNDVLSFVWKDSNGNVVGTTAIAQVTVSSGTRAFTLTVTDPGGLSSSASTQVTVQDTTAPSLSVSLSPNSLQPPNHKLVPIYAAVSASDACSANLAVSLVSIISNEPDNGTGDGDQPNDIQAISGGPVPVGTDVRSFLLRAERSGGGDGRIYTVTYSATDAAGNSTSASSVVVVGTALPDPLPDKTHKGRGYSGGREDHDKDKNHKEHDKDKDNDRGGKKDH
ncbi:MAG TPA: PKD domain-containing protein [Candidatus Acidoferrum sp.]|nr:PKD domain-containing protein [Candidatus Acidoferrum sp.]